MSTNSWQADAKLGSLLPVSISRKREPPDQLCSDWLWDRRRSPGTARNRQQCQPSPFLSMQDPGWGAILSACDNATCHPTTVLTRNERQQSSSCANLVPAHPLSHRLRTTSDNVRNPGLLSLTLIGKWGSRTTFDVSKCPDGDPYSHNARLLISHHCENRPNTILTTPELGSQT